jgi:hypothetical protein
MHNRSTRVLLKCIHGSNLSVSLARVQSCDTVSGDYLSGLTADG